MIYFVCGKCTDLELSNQRIKKFGYNSLKIADTSL